MLSCRPSRRSFRNRKIDSFRRICVRISPSNERHTLRGLLRLRLSFITKRIREICERDHATRAAFGDEAASLLHDAIAELRAAPTIGDVADWSGRMHSRKRIDELDFQFGGLVEIVFAVNHVKHPTSDVGDIAWERVSSIKILKLEIKNVEDN